MNIQGEFQKHMQDGEEIQNHNTFCKIIKMNSGSNCPN
jgi:hypothetical protein